MLIIKASGLLPIWTFTQCIIPTFIGLCFLVKYAETSFGKQIYTQA